MTKPQREGVGGKGEGHYFLQNLLVKGAEGQESKAAHGGYSNIVGIFNVSQQREGAGSIGYKESE